MKYIISSQNIRTFARALHSLARIGDDLFLEFKNDGMIIRTVNSAQSAYSTFTFNEHFFHSFSVDINDSVKCKISMKSCLAVFKTPHGVERNIDTCYMQMNDDTSQLIFELKYIRGYKKTHFVPILENENIELTYSKDGMPNSVTIQSNPLHNAVKHFRAHDEEITFSFTPKKINLRNYCDNLEDKKFLRTELCLQSGDFNTNFTDVIGGITFSLKELRAIVFFSELGHIPVVISFERAGQPVIFTIKSSLEYEADYVISTLPPELINDYDDRNTEETDSISISTPPSSSVDNRSKIRRTVGRVDTSAAAIDTAIGREIDNTYRKPASVANTTTTPATDRCRISAAAINTPAGIVRHPGSTVNTPDVYNLSDAMNRKYDYNFIGRVFNRRRFSANH